MNVIKLFVFNVNDYQWRNSLMKDERVERMKKLKEKDTKVKRKKAPQASERTKTHIKRVKKSEKNGSMKKSEKKNEKRRMLSSTKLYRQFMCLTAIPILVVCLVLAAFSVHTLSKGLSERSVEGIKAVSATTQATIKTFDSRDYVVDSHGDVYKGEYKMSGNNQIFINIGIKSHMNLTFYYGSTSIATSRKAEGDAYRVGEEADARLVSDVLETGSDHVYENFSEDGISTYAYCAPIANTNGKVVGMLLITMDRAQVQAYIRSQLLIMIVAAILMFVICVSITTVFSRNIVDAILINKEVVDRLAEGDFTLKQNKKMSKIMKRKDEIGEMIRAVDGLQKRLVDVISQMKQVAERLLENGATLGEIASNADLTATDIGAAVNEVAINANEQASEVGEAFDRINAMGQLIGKIVTSVHSLNENAQTMLKTQKISESNFERLTKTNDNTLAAIEQVAEQIKKTNDSIKSINEAVDMISAIAEQTNLLSLNASIEAARAGDAGKGFAVVASEIQKLATESNESAQRIKANIEEVVANSASSMSDMEKMQNILDEQIECLQETVEQFKQFAEGVVSTSNEAKQINEYASQCDNARQSTQENMNALAAISEQNASGAEETTASMETLTTTMSVVADSSNDIEKVAKEVSSSLDFFKL